MIKEYFISIFLTLAIIGAASDFIKYISKDKDKTKVVTRAFIYLTAIVGWIVIIYEHIKKIME
jgi:hypothetical protein